MAGGTQSQPLVAWRPGSSWAPVTGWRGAGPGPALFCLLGLLAFPLPSVPRVQAGWRGSCHPGHSCAEPGVPGRVLWAAAVEAPALLQGWLPQVGTVPEGEPHDQGAPELASLVGAAISGSWELGHLSLPNSQSPSAREAHREGCRLKRKEGRNQGGFTWQGDRVLGGVWGLESARLGSCGTEGVPWGPLMGVAHIT